MKKLIALVLLTITLMVALTSCGGPTFDVNPTDMCNTFNYLPYGTYNGWYYGNYYDGEDYYFALGQEGELLSGYQDCSRISGVKDREIFRNVLFSNDYVYFLLNNNENASRNGLWRCTIGGSNLEQIQKGKIQYLQVLDDKLIYGEITGVKQGNVYRCNLDGSDRELLIDKSAYYPYLSEDTLFYQDDYDHERLHMYNLKTEEDEALTKNHCYNYFIDGDYIFYIGIDDKGYREGKNDKLIKHNIKTGEEEILADNVSGANLQTLDDKVYYIGDGENYRLYRINKDGTGNTLVVANYCSDIQIKDGMLYYIVLQEERGADGTWYFDKVYRSDLDGGNAQQLVNLNPDEYNSYY